MTSAAAGISIVGAGVAVSDHLTEYPVLTAQGIRYVLGAALLALVAGASGRREAASLGADDWVRLVALASTGMVLFNVAVVRAVSTGEPAVVGTIVGLAPIGVALLVPVLERRRPSAVIVAGASLSASGAAIVQGFGDADLAALCWSVVALGCEVAFTVLAAPLLRRLSPLGLSIRACALASIMLLAAATLVDRGAAFSRPGAGETLAIGYLAVASTALAFVLWYRALARLGPERTILFAGLMPISAALVGAAGTDASLRPGTLIGALVTALGLIVGLGHRPRPRPVAPTCVGADEVEPPTRAL
jgi:drug/metabolite transporter (DMT)-like permease